MKILITSGGTKIKIDDVRHIGNMSKGTFGSDICKAFLEKGHVVDFLMAEESKTPFEFKFCASSMEKVAMQDIEDKWNGWMHFVRKYGSSYKDYKYKTFDDYKDKIEALLKLNNYDMVILAAAVSDFGVENVVNGKIRSKGDMEIKLKPLPKIINSIKFIQPKTFLVGFKLMVNSTYSALLNESEMSIQKNACDLVVANDLNDIKKNNHSLLVVNIENKAVNVKNITKNEAESYGLTLAEMLVDRILDVYGRKNV